MNIIYNTVKELRTPKRKNVYLNFIEKRVGAYNFDTKNISKIAIKLAIEEIIVGILYLIYCWYFFHGIWYLNALIILSTIIFLICYLDLRLDSIHSKSKADIPTTTRRINFYLTSTKNACMAIEKTEKRTSSQIKPYLIMIREALEDENCVEQIERIKNKLNAPWLKMLTDALYTYKLYGDENGVIVTNIERIAQVVETVAVNEGMDNASLKMIQMYVFLTPLVALPGIEAFNNVILDAFGTTLDGNSQAFAALILLFSNVSTLFISWIRKGA